MDATTDSVFPYTFVPDVTVTHAPSPSPAPPETPTATIMDKAVCMVVSKGKFGNRRKASVSQIMEIAVDEVVGENHDIDVDSESRQQVDREVLSATKRLLESTELAEISALDHEVSAFLKKLALPSMFKSGVYLVPIALVEKIEDAMREFRDRRALLVEKFVAVYPTRIEEIKAKLGPLFNRDDYPSDAAIADLFAFDWQYVTFGVPGSLKQLKAGIFEDEKQKYAKKLEEAAEACTMTMRAAFSDLVANLREKISPVQSADGKTKKRVLKKASVENLNQFLQVFDLRNVANDKELAALVSKTRELMNGIDADTLRSDDLIRQKVRDGFAEVEASLESMVIDRQSRRIELLD